MSGRLEQVKIVRIKEGGFYSTIDQIALKLSEQVFFKKKV